MIKDVSGVMNDYNEIIKNILPEYFDIATVYNNKAYNLIQVNQFAKALPLVNKALALDKNKGYIWDTRGELFYKLKDYQKCIQDMSRAINLTETSANSYYYRGLAYFKLNKKSEGCSDLFQARQHGNLESNKILTENCR